MSDDASLETLLVGIDAACLSVVRPLVDAGKLPTLASLFERGAVGDLESQLPPWTPSAWPSLYTGVNPGRHGVFGFLAYEGYDWRVVDATDVRTPSLWELLDAEDRRSVVVNVPVTNPPAAFDGALLSGFVGPDDPACHPPGLLEEVREAIGDYHVYSRYEFDGTASRDDRVAEYRRLVEQRGRAFEYLADRFDPHFGFLQFQQTDTVFHDLPGDEAAVEAVYEAVDAELARVLDACDPETVVVASDHGIGHYESEFRVNEFLEREGFLTTTTEGAGMPSWVPLWRESLSGEDDAEGSGRDETGKSRDEKTDIASADPADTADDGVASGTSGRTRAQTRARARDSLTRLAMTGLARTLSLASRVGVTPGRVADGLDRVGLLPVVKRHVPESLLQEAAPVEHVDFANSKAYMRLPVELGVRINLTGREPDGVVSAEEYESVRADLIERLEAVETPAGEPVFSDVLPREAVFSGPAVEDAVDVVLVPRDFEQFPAARLVGDLFGPPGEPWNHRLQGLVSVTGPGVDPGDLTDAHLLQVAPTVLATLGVPRSEEMEAPELPVVSPAGERRYPPRTLPTAVEGSDASVETRLEDLGYL